MPAGTCRQPAFRATAVAEELNQMANASDWGVVSRRALALTVVVLLGAVVAQAADTKPPSKPSVGGSDLAEILPFINKQIAEQWEANKITPSARCTDPEYLRRAFLDLVGRVARPEKIRKFMSDPAESRRALLINRLVGDEDAKNKTKYGQEYAKNWAHIWSVWLLTRSGSTDPARKYYHEQM